MRVFLFSDIHFREYSPFVNYNAITESGYTREIENFLRGCRFLADTIKEYSPDICFNLGDTIHLPTGVSLRLLKAIDEGMGWIEESCKSLNIPLLHLIGNHDTYSEELGIDFSTFFKHRYGTCYNQPQIETYKDVSFDIVPFTSDIEFLTRKLRDTTGRIILTHNEFVGAQYDNNQFSPSSIAKKTDDVVISGHIHKPQFSGGVIYVGSLISMKFEHIDTSLAMGAIIYDTENQGIIRIPNNRSAHYIKLYSSEEVNALPNTNYIIKLYTSEPKRDIENLINSREILYIHKPEKTEGIKTTFVQARSSKDSLRDYIETENPDALEIFDKYSAGQYSND